MLVFGLFIVTVAVMVSAFNSTKMDNQQNIKE